MQTRKTPPEKEEVKEILSSRLYDLVGEKTESTGLKQEEQAKEAGIASYAKYLDQKRKHPTTLPESYSLYCIAEYYGVSCDYLLGREDAPDSQYASVVDGLGLSQAVIERLENWRNEVQVNPARFARKHDRAITILSFIDKLLYSAHIEEIATCARKFQSGLKGSIEQLQFFIDNQERISAELDPETNEPKYVQLMREIEYGVDMALLYEYKAKERLGALMEQLGEHSKQELRLLQDKFMALCERLDVDGTH